MVRGRGTGIGRGCFMVKAMIVWRRQKGGRMREAVKGRKNTGGERERGKGEDMQPEATMHPL